MGMKMSSSNWGLRVMGQTQGFIVVGLVVIVVNIIVLYTVNVAHG